jgi:hypothetical protein
LRIRAIAAALLVATTASTAASGGSLDPKADEVIARSRAATSTYAIYWRVRTTSGVKDVDHAWGATFRQGSLVRVEDARSRAIADCATMKAAQFSISIGRSEYSNGPKIAKRYCGIDADRKVRSARWLGQKQGQFGLIDEVEVIDEDGTFTYQVASGGELVGITASYRGSGYEIVAEPMSIERNIPAGDLFSRSSLTQSRVPKLIQNQGSRPER